MDEKRRKAKRAEVINRGRANAKPFSDKNLKFHKINYLVADLFCDRLSMNSLFFFNSGEMLA